MRLKTRKISFLAFLGAALTQIQMSVSIAIISLNT